jgi:glycosyltransferase involved in cell wall biosynthesis
VITVNDGSADATLEALAAHGDRVKVLSQPNSGVSKTRNSGARTATGDWIAFCDSDDTWHPRKLELLAAVIETLPESEFLFHDFSITLDEVLVVERATESREHSLFPVFKRRQGHRMADFLGRGATITAAGFTDVCFRIGAPLDGLMQGNFVQPSTTALRAELFRASGGFDEDFRHAEDTEYYLQLGKDHSFTYVDAPLMTYKVLRGSLLNTSLLPTTENGTRALIRHCVEDERVLARDPRRIRRLVARKLARLAYLYLTELDRERASARAREALSYNPKDSLAWMVRLASLAPVAMLDAARRAKSLFSS